ncbi:hypothetical protein B296_00014403 [Ensete ventricosum]|uniref:Uncharacterized protein n=1 Tax=Ensete ventricosum TaxID=4639 RepID=A0A427AH07_ENSVE|nr:hypothetical protein B296_00014403 [Ensete ventricosum]
MSRPFGAILGGRFYTYGSRDNRTETINANSTLGRLEGTVPYRALPTLVSGASVGGICVKSADAMLCRLALCQVGSTAPSTFSRDLMLGRSGQAVLLRHQVETVVLTVEVYLIIDLGFWSSSLWSKPESA